MLLQALIRTAIAALSLAAFCLAAEARTSRPLRLVVLGDSLSSGFLIPSSQAFPAVLEATLRAEGMSVTVVNAAVTNDTSWGGLSRVDRDVPADADGVILELGANDMVRMADAETTRASLEQIVTRLKARGIPVLLAGFRMPIAWGHDAARFEEMYRSLAQRHRLAYYPDFYSGLWSHPGYRLIDGIHPSPEGVRLIVSGILPTVRRFVASLPGRSPRVADVTAARQAPPSRLPAPAPLFDRLFPIGLLLSARQP